MKKFDISFGILLGTCLNNGEFYAHVKLIIAIPNALGKIWWEGKLEMTRKTWLNVAK